MRTNIPIFTTHSGPLDWNPPPLDYVVLGGAGFESAKERAFDLVMEQHGQDMPIGEDGDGAKQAIGTMRDAVERAFAEGNTLDEWVSAALRILRAPAARCCAYGDRGTDLACRDSDGHPGSLIVRASLNVAGSIYLHASPTDLWLTVEQAEALVAALQARITALRAERPTG